MWSQRARSDYLKHGDSNTRWFHARANMHRARNYINHLVDDEAEFIDKATVSRREELIRELFLPVDVDVILNIPLCPSWPQAKLMWHYTNDGTFTVRSAYHLLILEVVWSNGECSSNSIHDIWRSIWKLNVSPHIRVFAWRIGKSILPTGDNLSKQPPSFDMRRAICSHPEESDSHALLDYLLASKIWNARNCFIFAHPDHDPEALSKRALAFVAHFRQAHELEPSLATAHPCSWKPPDPGTYKLNFDGG
ncbi:hypothetical protein Cgig2_016948 [Carnegiea gigantea]|uniref:Reverse transcriptase zinc-binding domain-containing protein n=1 Tax=Carnegiea gigantea TaxID=171969 RepID=A0A9Q1Q441_9CARY|nr:hypothetical protein Cgig2_016948 [Carnegiea gigantea]